MPEYPAISRCVAPTRTLCIFQLVDMRQAYAVRVPVAQFELLASTASCCIGNSYCCSRGKLTE